MFYLYTVHHPHLFIGPVVLEETGPVVSEETI